MHAKPAARWFYSLASLLLLLLTVWGFHYFYLGGRAYPGHPLPPPVRGLLIGHGLLMSLWMLLAVAQPWLVATRRRKLHMAVGKVGAVLALLIVITGVITAIQSVRITPQELVRFTLAPRAFLMVPMSAITLFGLLVAVGLWQRRNPAVHRPCMLLGSLAAVSAAMGRITVFNAWLAGSVLESWLTAFVTTSLLAGLLWLVKSLLDRSVDRWFGMGALALVVWFTVCSQLARTAW